MQSPSIPDDPNLQAEKDQAQNDLMGALQTQTQGDMGSLMARYGTQLAYASSGSGSGAAPVGSPLSIPNVSSRF